MVILDTNVISALMHQRPPLAVKQWLDRQPSLSVWTTSITVFEIRTGIDGLPAGRRRRSLEAEFARVIEDDMERRILSFDEAAANVAGALMAERKRTGRTGELRDTMIAGIVIVSHAMLATHNVRHFSDLSIALVNPWDS